MQATSRSRAAGFVPPPPPPASWNPRPAPLKRAALPAGPIWMEDAAPRAPAKRALEQRTTLVADIAGLPRPSRLARFARRVLILAALVSVTGAAARWRYPAQTAVVVARAREIAARVGPPSSWMSSARIAPPSTWLPAVRAHLPSVPPVSEWTNPFAETPAPRPYVVSASPAPVPAPVSAPTPVVDVMSLPQAASPDLAAAPRDGVLASRVAPPTPGAEIDARHPSRPAVADAKRAAHAPHHAANGAPPPEPVEAAPAPVAAPPPAPAVPAPGSLDAAIKRAGGPGKLLNVTLPTAPAPKPTADPSLPERPSASLVSSALMTVLPDARACMSDGEDPKQAVVVFESSGAVGSVTVSGPSAPCIQKALGRARVSPFSQPTYRATVPVRPE